jgi:three-Cys-motif partner protein
MAARAWGWWTEQKLDILSGYLEGFTRASKRAGTTVYLDLFAGQAENVSRERSGHTIRGSARRALDTQPPFSVLRFFELPSNARALDDALKAEYPDRDFQVIPGDCNRKIAEVLSDLAGLNWAPTFAFLDQQSTEVNWSTLHELAQHKRAGKPKTELWLLCASGLLPRGLKIRQDIDSQVANRISTTFGTDTWIDALNATRGNLLTAAEFRAELTNLMRWRLERDLGYRKTRVFSVTNTSGTEIFDMIFATDHDVGDKIMASMNKKAVREQPMRRLRAKLERKQTRQERDGAVGLFDLGETIAEFSEVDLYHVEHQHAPARPPYQHP